MMLVPLRAVTVNPKRILRAAIGYVRAPSELRQQPLDTYRIRDLHRQIPARQNLHFGIDKILAGGTHCRAGIDLIDSARVHHVAHKQFRLGFVNGRSKEDRRPPLRTMPIDRAYKDLPLVLEQDIENVLQIQAGRRRATGFCWDMVRGES